MATDRRTRLKSLDAKKNHRFSRLAWTGPLAMTLLVGLSACAPSPADEVSKTKGAVVYGNDTRRNFYDASTAEKPWLSATALVTSFSNITDQGGFERMGLSDVGLCSGEKFAGEWRVKDAGSAFLAFDDQTMVTAAHVDPCETKPLCDPATDPNACLVRSVVFGYQRFQEATALNAFGEPTYTETSSDRRFHCESVIS